MSSISILGTKCGPSSGLRVMKTNGRSMTRISAPQERRERRAQRPPPPRHTGRSHSLKNEEIPQILASPPSHKSSLKWSSQHRSIFIILKIFMSCWVGRLTLWSSLAPLCCYQVQPGEILWKSRAERNLFKYKVLKVSKGSMIYWWKIPWYIIPFDSMYCNL